jgi:nitroreductase
MELREAIIGRRTIRTFKSDPIPRSVLEEVMELALWAPSSGDDHQYELIVFQGERRAQVQAAVIEVIDEIRAYCAKEFPGDPDLARRAADFCLDFGGAPVLVFAYAGKLPDGQDDNFGISVALQNMFLGAYAAGLGTCWAALPPENSVESAAGIGDNGKSLVGVVPIGYPAETPRPSARKDSRIKWIGF